MLEGIDVGMSIRVEKGRGNISGGDTPITDHFAVQKDDRPEDATVVMCLVAMVRMKDDLAALITDQILIVRRKKMHATAAETPGAGVAVQDEFEAFPMLMNQFISKQGYSQTAIVESKAAPPCEILDSGGAVATEVLPGQQGQGFFPWQGSRRGQLL